MKIMENDNKPSSIKIQKGRILIYRAYDVAEEIDLWTLARLLPGDKKDSRVSLSGTPRQALSMRASPVRIPIGTQELTIRNRVEVANVTATFWDYGVVSLIFEIPIAEGTPVGDLIPVSAAINSDIVGTDDIDRAARDLLEKTSKKVAASFKAPSHCPFAEDYLIFFIEQLNVPEGASYLRTSGFLPELLLGEEVGKLSDQVRASLAEHFFQYGKNDLAAIDWNSAVVVEPTGQRDVIDVVEFALSHLLEFRYFDDLLDKRLIELYDAIEARRGTIWKSRYAQILRDANRKFIEFSEFIERVDNSLKVVGDFYVAVVYRAALRRFRIQDWQASITRKMGVLARVSEILQGEINVHRAHVLEIIIIFLIAFEIVSAILKGVFSP